MLQETTITVDGIEKKELSFGVKYVIVSGKTKYEFFETKRDGSETVAFKQFNEYTPKMGETIVIAVDSEEKEFTDQKGQKRKYMQNTIRSFKGIVPGGQPVDKPVDNSQKVLDNAIIERLETLIEDHEKRLKSIEFRLDAEDMISGK